MKKNICKIMVAFSLLSILLPMKVRAAGRDGFQLDENGTVTIVSQHAAKEEISSLGFSLSVNSPDASKVEFQFGESKGEILEFRYDENTKRLNVYVAGTEALFAEGADSLTLGKILVLDESGKEAAAQVSVVEDSLQYVYGTELKNMQDMDLPGVVQIGYKAPPMVTPPPAEPPAATQPPEEPQPPAVVQPSDDDQDWEEPQPPAATRAPLVTTTRPTGQVVRATPKPQATKAPTLAQNTGNTSGSSSPTPDKEPQPTASSIPEETPDAGGDRVVPSQSPEGESTGQTGNEEGESNGINTIVVIAIIAVVVVVGVMVMAFVVLKKKPTEPEE